MLTYSYKVFSHFIRSYVSCKAIADGLIRLWPNHNFSNLKQNSILQKPSNKQKHQDHFQTCQACYINNTVEKKTYDEVENNQPPTYAKYFMLHKVSYCAKLSNKQRKRLYIMKEGKSLQRKRKTLYTHKEPWLTYLV